MAAELLNLLPGVRLHSGLTEREAAIVTELRLPRVVLGLLVGAMLALAGGCYQGVFRNPLADPYLLGVGGRRRASAVTAVIALRGSAIGRGHRPAAGRHAARRLRRRARRGRAHLRCSARPAAGTAPRRR